MVLVPGLLPILTLIGNFGICQSWGSDGHRVISQIALDLVGHSALKLVENLITDEDLVEASLWADSSVAESRYPESSSYHFSHTPYRNCAQFDFSRDCGFRSSGLCLVTGVSRFLAVLIDPYRSREERQDALKFILHLVGDMHQPLHTGFREDAGATSLNVTLLDASTLSLHEVFDFDIIQRYKSVMTPPHWGTVAAKSVSMIRNMPAIVSRYSLTSDLDQYLESEDTMQSYAASIVSEMTTTVTCNYAYRNQNGTYIENNEKLSEGYYKSRTAGVMTLLVKAGIRLAKLLDAVAVEYYERKSVKDAMDYEERVARAVARLFEPTPSPEPRPDSNRYAILAIDCDPETLVEDADDEPEEESLVTVPVGSESSPRSPIVVKRQKIAKHATGPILYEGVDLDSLILIRRKKQYMITDKRLVISHKYVPLNIIAFNVRFNKTGEVKFYFDMAVFPPSMSDELALRVILKLNGIVIREDETIAKYVNSTGLTREAQYDFAEPIGSEKIRPGFTVALIEDDPVARQAKVDLVRDVNAQLKAEHAARQIELNRQFAELWSRRFVSIGQYMESKLRTNRNQVVAVTYDRMKMFVLVETLKRPITERLRFNFLPVQTLAKEDGGIKAGILIDPDIFEGPITSEIAKILQSIEKTNRGLSRRNVLTRPTLMDELSDVNSMFYGTDPDRISKRKVLVEFMVYPGDEFSRYLVFEWALTATMFSSP